MAIQGGKRGGEKRAQDTAESEAVVLRSLEKLFTRLLQLCAFGLTEVSDTAGFKSQKAK